LVGLVAVVLVCMCMDARWQLLEYELLDSNTTMLKQVVPDLLGRCVCVCMQGDSVYECEVEGQDCHFSLGAQPTPLLVSEDIRGATLHAAVKRKTVRFWVDPGACNGGAREASRTREVRYTESVRELLLSHCREVGLRLDDVYFTIESGEETYLLMFDVQEAETRAVRKRLECRPDSVFGNYYVPWFNTWVVCPAAETSIVTHLRASATPLVQVAFVDERSGRVVSTESANSYERVQVVCDAFLARHGLRGADCAFTHRGRALERFAEMPTQTLWVGANVAGDAAMTVDTRKTLLVDLLGTGPVCVRADAFDLVEPFLRTLCEDEGVLRWACAITLNGAALASFDLPADARLKGLPSEEASGFPVFAIVAGTPHEQLQRVALRLAAAGAAARAAAGRHGDLQTEDKRVVAAAAAEEVTSAAFERGLRRALKRAKTVRAAKAAASIASRVSDSNSLTVCVRLGLCVHVCCHSCSMKDTCDASACVTASGLTTSMIHSNQSVCVSTPCPPIHAGSPRLCMRE
jgi:hypothetical protein